MKIHFKDLQNIKCLIIISKIYLILITTLIFFLTLLGCGTETLPDRKNLIIRGTIIIDGNTKEEIVGVISESTYNNQSNIEIDRSFTITTFPIKNTVELIVTIEGAESSVIILTRLPDSGEISFDLLYNTFTKKTSLYQPDLIPTPNIAETPSPNNNLSKFDQNGVTTEFGIPNGIYGTISEGEVLWKNRCSGCHGLRGEGYNFNRLKKVISEPPMNIILPDRILADITAYLNRRN
jgi:hypothetical protein